jgi:hypothetical protein
MKNERVRKRLKIKEWPTFAEAAAGKNRKKFVKGEMSARRHLK